MKLERDILETLVGRGRVDSKGQNLYASCPWCGEGEFGISLREYHQYRCFRGNKCGETGNIFTLLKFLGRTELLGDRDYYRETDVYGTIDNKFEKIVEEDVTLPNVSYPLGWRRVESDEYLEGRGFTDDQFSKYEIGISKLDKRFKGYVVFLIRYHGFIKAYIGRSTKSKEEIDFENDCIKAMNKSRENSMKIPMVLRYRNSTTDFSKILYGIDEVTDSTETVIVVEGLFDKINLEIIYPELFVDDKVVVCCTWGKKMSEEQIQELLLKSVQHVVLMYDPDAIEDSKKYSYQLLIHIPRVEVGKCVDKDPGDLTKEEFVKILDSVASPEEFRLDNLNKRYF